MIRWIRRFRDGIGNLTRLGLDLLFPPCCVYCSTDFLEPRDDWHFCDDCLALFGPATWRGCNRCGNEVPDSVPVAENCQSCRKACLRFDTVIPLGGYHTGLRDAILRMKRPEHDGLSTAMGRLLAERRGEQLAAIQADIVVPIPTFVERRWIGRRKRNHSPEVLAACVAESLKIPMQGAVLVQHVATLPQVGLAPTRRFENVRGAFQVCSPEVVKGARVLLVDDVLTTGATCSEAAKMLKQAGAAMVAVAVVARTQGTNGKAR